MPEYRVTFGSQYGSPEYGADPHPRVGYLAHRDGYFTIVADDELRARELTIALLETAWSNLYAPEDVGSESEWAATFPRGELLRVIDPAMTSPVELLIGTTDAPQVLVTVWANGTRTIAARENSGQSWGVPNRLEIAP